MSYFLWLIDLLDTLRVLRGVEKKSVGNTVDVLQEGEIEDLLRELRKRHLLTQAELAAKLGINRQSVLRWEKGHKLISVAHLERLCYLLGASPEERQALQ